MSLNQSYHMSFISSFLNKSDKIIVYQRGVLLCIIIFMTSGRFAKINNEGIVTIYTILTLYDETFVETLDVQIMAGRGLNYVKT